MRTRERETFCIRRRRVRVPPLHSLHGAQCREVEQDPSLLLLALGALVLDELGQDGAHRERVGEPKVLLPAAPPPPFDPKGAQLGVAARLAQAQHAMEGERSESALGRSGRVARLHCAYLEARLRVAQCERLLRRGEALSVLLPIKVPFDG